MSIYKKLIIKVFVLLFLMVIFCSFTYTQDTKDGKLVRYFFSIPYWNNDVYQIEPREAMERGNYYRVEYFTELKPQTLEYYNNWKLQYRYVYDESRIIKKRESYKDGVPNGFWYEYIEVKFFAHTRRRIFYDTGIPVYTTLFTYYANGKVRSEENFEGETDFIKGTDTMPDESARDGYTRIYSRNGNILYEVFYTENLKNGVERIADLSKLKITIPFSETDEIIQNVLSQYPNLQVENTPEMMKKIIIKYPQIEADKLKEIYHFTDGVRELQSTLFDYETNTKINKFYKEGQEVRKDITVKDKLGRTIKIEKFVNSTMNYGLWEYYDTEARLIKTERYKDGLKHGEWQYYEYINGVRKIVMMEKYENNDLLFTRIFEYDSKTGKRLNEYGFKDGLPDKEWFYYDKNHNLVEKQEYKDGKPDGIWIWWKVLDDGRLQTEKYVIYKEGEIIETHSYSYDEND